MTKFRYRINKIIDDKGNNVKFFATDTYELDEYDDWEYITDRVAMCEVIDLVTGDKCIVSTTKLRQWQTKVSILGCGNLAVEDDFFACDNQSWGILKWIDDIRYISCDALKGISNSKSFHLSAIGDVDCPIIFYNSSSDYFYSEDCSNFKVDLDNAYLIDLPNWSECSRRTGILYNHRILEDVDIMDEQYILDCSITILDILIELFKADSEGGFANCKPILLHVDSHFYEITYSPELYGHLAKIAFMRGC